MDAMECILTRNSVRKFKPDVVPRETLEKVLSSAQRSPSYKNSQPWEAVVVSGAKKDELSALLVGMIENDVPLRPDIPEAVDWPRAIADRMRAASAKRNKAFGVDASLSPKDALKRSKIANFRFYGAPHCIFIYMDSGLTLWSVFDMGCFAQTLMLAAKACGLGTVPQAYVTDYSSDVKKFLGIPGSKRLVLGMSIGYADLSVPAGTYISDRAPLDDVVRWVE
ncbi:MAG: nitroreductase [Nitrospinae bacterium]|nr:nitroreductase [Nitrospinota bacterium]